MSPDILLEQTQWDTHWVPPETTIIDRPELLCLSHPSGSPPLNAACRLRAPDTDLDALIAEVSAQHTGWTSRIPVTPQTRRPALLAALRRAGYAPGHAHDGYTIATDTPRRPIAAGLTIKRVEDLPTLRDAITITNLAFNRDQRPDPDALDGWLRGCAPEDGRVHRFVIYAADDEPLTTGGMTTYPDLDFAFLWAGGTTPAGRSRGAYSALVTARLQQARAHNIAACGLYARLDTSAPIVAAQGFARHGRMVFWDRPAP
jgi:GNAT superfamily N-acetyltransferase